MWECYEVLGTVNARQAVFQLKVIFSTHRFHVILTFLPNINLKFVSLIKLWPQAGKFSQLVPCTVAVSPTPSEGHTLTYGGTNSLPLPILPSPHALLTCSSSEWALGMKVLNLNFKATKIQNSFINLPVFKTQKHFLKSFCFVKVVINQTCHSGKHCQSSYGKQNPLTVVTRYIQFLHVWPVNNSLICIAIQTF